uniref:Transposase n=1 Tax=Leptobrachium leishanense TaxID=445787 RepID=A0A8C5LXJ6_9ANUR
MVRRALPKDQRDLIVKKYQSGEGYKKISKELDISWNTVKAVIIKWRKYGAPLTLPTTGRPSKCDEKIRKLDKEAVKRPTGKAVVRRELPKDQRDLIVKRYQSGEGYKRISKELDISWNTVKAVIIKWRKYGTTLTLPRTGRPYKCNEKTTRKLVKEAAKRPTATLKELQEYLASTGCVVHVTTISRILHMSGLWGRAARLKTFLKKNLKDQLNFAKTQHSRANCVEIPEVTEPEGSREKQIDQS